MNRNVDSMSSRQRFLIVCEGVKTEPLYFKNFRVPRLCVEVIGEGRVTTSLVEEALRLSAEAKKRKEPYDQVWCMFDKDDNSTDQFERAIIIAKNNGIKVAYSNQSFELWYVLHFDYMDNAINRSQYIQILNEHFSRLFSCEYKKNDSDTYNNLKRFRGEAIQSSDRLLAEHGNIQPGKADPSTTVHLLVQELLKHAKPYNP